jgi:DNA-binding transcriptional ArsR family regulator
MIQEAGTLKQFFRALTSASRLRIVERLAGTREEISVGDLATQLRMSQPLVSWHLRWLRRVNLVRMRRNGRRALCSLNRQRLAYYQSQFAELFKEVK